MLADADGRTDGVDGRRAPAFLTNSQGAGMWRLELTVDAGAPRLDRLSRVLSPPQAVDLVLEGELLLRERGEALHRGSRLCQHLCAGREALQGYMETLLSRQDEAGDAGGSVLPRNRQGGGCVLQ